MIWPQAEKFMNIILIQSGILDQQRWSLDLQEILNYCNGLNLVLTRITWYLMLQLLEEFVVKESNNVSTLSYFHLFQINII